MSVSMSSLRVVEDWDSNYHCDVVGRGSFDKVGQIQWRSKSATAIR